jgi:hypothetical protein
MSSVETGLSTLLRNTRVELLVLDLSQGRVEGSTMRGEVTLAMLKQSYPATLFFLPNLRHHSVPA